MAKISIIEREKDKVKMVKAKGKRRADLKEAIRKAAGDFDTMQVLQTQLQKMKVNGSSARVRNRCRTCGRPHGVYRKFGLCRVHLREAMMRGDVPGCRKSSW